MKKLNKFGYTENTKKLNCGIDKIINNNFLQYNKLENKWTSCDLITDLNIKNKNLKFGTWNLWGAAHFSKLSLINKRIKYILQIIKNEDMDIICLQEVSQFIINKLLTTKFIKNNYYISSIQQPWTYSTLNINSSNYNGLEPNCWPIILSKYPVINSDYIVLKSEAIQFSGIVANFGFINVINIHLQSGGMASGKDKKTGLKYHLCRKDQIKEVQKFIKNNYDSKNIIYTGDFNTDLNIENLKIFPESKFIKNNLIDSWTYSGNKGIEGTTENTYKNTMRYNIKGIHKNYRYDGILYKSKILDATKSYLIGTDKCFDISQSIFKKNIGHIPLVLNKNNKVDWFASDHFGVVALFEIKK